MARAPKIDPIILQYALKFVRRVPAKPMDKRGRGRCMTGATFRWGFRTLNDHYVPFVIHWRKDGSWGPYNWRTQNMRKLKRHNRHAWILFRFLDMLSQCKPRSIDPLILMDRVTYRHIMGQYHSYGRVKNHPLQSIIRILRDAESLTPEAKAAESGVDAHVDTPFHLELRHKSPLPVEVSERCIQCWADYNRERKFKAPVRGTGPGTAWRLHGLFCCPYHTYALTEHPAYKCKYRTENLVLTQTGVKAMMAEIQCGTMSVGVDDNKGDTNEFDGITKSSRFAGSQAGHTSG